MNASPLNIGIVGAGPVGLALACAVARGLPQAQLQLFDAQAIDGRPRPDGRSLALSLGSIQWLRRLDCWPEAQAEPMHEVSVSQLNPGHAELRLRASELGVQQLGAVLPYASLLAAQQQAWLQLSAAAPRRLLTRDGQAVRALKPLSDGGVELDAGIVERFDLVALAEGGVFAEQSAKPWRRDYAQTAWVGNVWLEDAWPRGLAVERFTRDGPLAVLPLPAESGRRRAALVWCTASDEPAEALTLTRLRALLPRGAQAIAGFESGLKAFPLGLNAEPQPLAGRVLRIGNAAQTLHPVAGQGLNLGLRDAYTLVQALRELPDDTEAALRQVEWARAPDRWSMIATTDFLARSFTWRAPGVAAARGLALAALQAATPLKRLLARQMMYGRR